MANNPVRSNTPAPHAGEKESPAIPEFGQTPGMGAPPEQPDDRETKRDGKVPSEKPSFSSLEDDPLVTTGIGGSEEPKGRVRPGGGEVPADTDDEDAEPESGYSKHPDRTPGSAEGERDSDEQST